MSANASDQPAAIVPFAPISKGQSDANIVAHDSGEPLLHCCKRLPRWRRRTALGQWIWRIGFRRSFEQRFVLLLKRMVYPDIHQLWRGR